MSKIKTMLPEDIDVTDPRDTGNYGEPDEADLLTGWTMFDLDNLVSRVEQNLTSFTGETDELRAFADRLVEATLKIEKPF